MEKVIAREKLRDVAKYDSAIAYWIRSGAPLEEIIVTLAEQKRNLAKRVLDLQAIAPKKIIDSNGTIYIWRCPEEFIPELDFTKGGFFEEPDNK